jgi:DNA-binding SARP family transcriptional activator/tetratricopeptide (TPR) repeat protein
MVRYAILGSIELRDGERRVPVGGRRPGALLALLLVNANRALSTDRLIEALWDDQDPSATKRLQAAILRLRRTLDPASGAGESVLQTVAGGYMLTVAPGQLDADVFQARMHAGRRVLEAGDAQRALAVLGEALGMWRGPALAEVAYAEFAQPEIRRLEELRLAALEAWVEARLRLGMHGETIGELEALVTAHAGREHLAGQLMVALYRCGRQGDALDVYTRTRTYLAAELGLEPGPALQALRADILAQSPALQLPGHASGTAVADTSAAQADGALPTGVVTFLLTDVESSARLWDTDADAMAAALEVHDELIEGMVDRHRGRLLKHRGEGDATLSVFARASDAVGCAAALQDALRATSWPEQLDMRVRIALHSGEAQQRGGDYFGPVLNRAARLRSLAAGGVTMLSQSTAELARDRLPPGTALIDVGRHELRGLARAERVFELRPGADIGPVDPATAPLTLALPRALQTPTGVPFVGRDPQLERLRERWTQVEGGTGSAVVVGGEPGIGKTRLAAEFAGVVHKQGALVLYGRCDEGLAVPYQPFVGALRSYASEVGRDRLRAETGRLAPELSRLLPELAGLGEPVRGDPESERFALFEAVAMLIEAITREHPALLVLDDLHWAARPTLLLLRHLIRSERRLRVLMLGTYRGTELEQGDGLAQLLADLYRDATTERLILQGLDERAIAALLQAAPGHPPGKRASQLAHELHAQTAGNPFFVRELLAHRADSGEGPDATATSAAIPEEVRHVISHRVARLSESAARALSAAAVAGPSFSFVLLERVLGDRADVLDALDEAVAAGLLTDAEHGVYVFAHALVRQTIYGQLGSARRMRLHRQLGEALEGLDETQVSVEELAHHFAQAAADGQAVKAVDYALAAGRSASARLGDEEAVAHYERGLNALDLAGHPQEQRRCELLLALGLARWNTGALDKARETCLQAAELADELGDHAALARAALGFCGPHRFEGTTTVTRPIVVFLERTLSALGDSDSPLRAELMSRLAVYTDVEQRTALLARQGLEMARRVADKVTLADVIASTLWATRGPDTMHESMSLAAELGRLADDIGDRRLRTLAHRWLLEHLLELGDIDGAEREFEALQRLAATRRERSFAWLVAVFRASHAHLAGRISYCEALAHEAFSYRYEGHDDDAAQGFGSQMLFVRREQGRLDELLETVERFVEGNPHLAGWRCAVALIYAQLGRWPHARHEVEVLARDDFGDIRRDAYWLSNLSGLSEVVVGLGDAPRARVLYELLTPYAERCAVIFGFVSQGSVSHPLGLLATALTSYDEASRHFEHALTVNAHIRSPLQVAHTQHNYARMLLLRDDPGDRDKARQLLGRALATAEQLGLKAVADSARALKIDAETAAPSPDAAHGEVVS